MDLAVLVVQAFLNLSYIVFSWKLGYPRKEGYIPLELCPKFWTEKCCHSTSTVTECNKWATVINLLLTTFGISEHDPNAVDSQQTTVTCWSRSALSFMEFVWSVWHSTSCRSICASWDLFYFSSLQLHYCYHCWSYNDWQISVHSKLVHMYWLQHLCFSGPYKCFYYRFCYCCYMLYTVS